MPAVSGYQQLRGIEEGREDCVCAHSKNIGTLWP